MYEKCLKVMPKTEDLLIQNKNLKQALSYAIAIINCYETDIKSCQKPDLVMRGFCQGALYKSAIEDIKKKMEGKR